MVKLKERPILNKDLLEKLEQSLKKWDKDNPNKHFSMWAWCKFAVMTRGAPYMVEKPFLDIWKRVADGRKRRKLQLFPRGHFKSYGAKVFGAFLFCETDAHKWGPQIRLCVGGQTGKFAKRTVLSIRTMLETNQYILATYPQMKPTKKLVNALAETLSDRGMNTEISKGAWRQDHFRTMPCIRGEVESGIVLEEPSCWAQGMDEATTGYHMDVVLLDDPVGRATWKSPTKKETAREVWYDLQSQIMDGLIIVLGTRWATDDIHSTLIEEYFDSVDINYANVWGGGEEFYREDFSYNAETGRYDFLGDIDKATLFFDGAGTIDEEVRNGFRLDPEKRKLKTLYYIADKMHSYPPSVWTKQMLNRAHNAEDLVFNDEMFRWYDARLDLSGFPTYILTDSATGKDSRSSYRVVAAVTLDSSDVGYVREVQFGRWGPQEYMRRALIAYERYNCGKLLMEQVAWQDAFKSTADLLCQLEGRRNPKIAPVYGRSEVSKFERIEALEPRLRAGRLLFNPNIENETFDNKNCWKEIKRQFISCRDVESSRGMILDIPDALSDVEATDRDGYRICKPARKMRATKSLTREQQIQRGVRRDRTARRGVKQKTKGLRRPSGWR